MNVYMKLENPTLGVHLTTGERITAHRQGDEPNGSPCTVVRLGTVDVFLHNNQAIELAEQLAGLFGLTLAVIGAAHQQQPVLSDNQDAMSVSTLS